MSQKKTKVDAVVEGERYGAGTGTAHVDHLSDLPDALLHKVMSFLWAWEVARTCVLSRRWRNLWASVPCLDLRVCCKARHRRLPMRFAREDYCSTDVDMWIRAAINRRARFIELSHHPRDDAFSDLEHVPFISCHLKHLHLSGTMLRDKTLRQLSSQCPSLEVLELKECFLYAPQISSASLISLTMVECRIMADLSIAAPSLVSLRCVIPYHRAPSFENLGSLATGTIM
uniref:F-box domain-containing protein n=1 Tax=Aegilops tauschii subsp. strangulata TaxID=200361 RepID=A0A453B8R8_AEGTS